MTLSSHIDARPLVRFSGESVRPRRLSAAVEGAPPGASRTVTSPTGLRLRYRVADRVVGVEPGIVLLACGVRVLHLLPTAFDLSGLIGQSVEVEVEHALGPHAACELAIRVAGRVVLAMHDGALPANIPCAGFSAETGLCYRGQAVPLGFTTVGGHDVWVAESSPVRLTCVLVAL